MRRHRRPRTFTHAHRQRLERAAEHYLQYCYGQRTAARASEFAEYLDVTHAYLSRIVPEIAGMTLRSFLRQKQLAYASRLLRRAAPLPIREIAIRCGFGTVSTFYRCFEVAYGRPPGSFREVKE
jgi:AraC-like DNA-binding protein